MAKQSSNTTTKKPAKNFSDGFLEAFRDLGSGMAKDAKQSIFGVPPSSSRTENTPNLFSRENLLERDYRRQWQRSEQIRREEKVLFSRQQQETQKHVAELQEEIRSLAKATGDLAKEVNISAMQVSADTPASAYHLNFFEHLKRLVRQLKTQINDSAVWLGEFNKKSKKKTAYWGGVKKQGAKFLLSQDRYMATQTG